MKFFIVHKVLLLAAAVAIIYVLLLVPFIEVKPSPWSINPCPQEYGVRGLCNPNRIITLRALIQSNQHIISIYWWDLAVAVLMLFIFFSNLFWLFLNVIKKKKKSQLRSRIFSLIGFIIIFLILVFSTHLLIYLTTSGEISP